MSRAERLQLILSLIKTSPGIRPADLAARCRVSERSIFRDLHALQALGLPVHFDRGYRLPSPAFLPALHLTGEEALALRVAASRGAKREGPMARALLSAQSKLALRLEPASPSLGGQMPLALPGVPSGSTDAAHLLSILQEAMATGRRLTIKYARTEGGRPRSIDLTPRHLSLREDGWLLMADDPAKHRSRTIRLDQIKEASLSERKGGRSRPAGRKGAAAHVGTGLRVKLRLRPPLTALAADGHLPEGLRIEHRNGGIFLLMSYASGMWELLGWLLSFGPSIEVIEPIALRSELKRVAAELLALYGTET
jgi:predicted DNA-binding transcriptional regulator YafY